MYPSERLGDGTQPQFIPEICVEELRDRPETALVRLEGVLDLDGVALANRKILPLIDRGCVNLAFDCTLLRYLNSPALGSLVAYTKKAREQGGECNLFGVSPDVLDVLAAPNP